MKSMSLATSPSETQHTPPGLDSVRVSGGIGVHVESQDGRNTVTQLYQRDGYKVRFPKRGPHPEAVIINTGGGVASGDHIAQEYSVAEGAALTVTTQACERIYRQLNDTPAIMDIRVKIAGGATFNWLPQETILFKHGGLRRRFDIELTASSRVCLAETLVLGRRAMGETVTSGYFRDTWRITRDRKLVFAEDIRLDDSFFSQMQKPSLSQGHRIFTTMVFLSEDAEDHLERTRALLKHFDGEIAASTWNNMLVIRALTSTTQSIHRIMAELIPILAGREQPRVWLT